MRAVARVGLMALLVSVMQVGQASAGATEQGAAEQCSGNSQAGMRDCLVAKVAASAAALKEAEARAQDAIGAWDEDAKYASAAKAGLRASGAAFARFSQAHCGFASALAGGAAGNARDMIRLACVADLNVQRAHDLARRAKTLIAR